MEGQRGLVLITGASGLLGMSLVERLREDYIVVGLDRGRHPDWPNEIAFVEADITDDQKLQTSLDQLRHEHGNKIASVLHLIAYYDFSGQDSPLYQKVTVEGTRRLLRLLRETFEVEQFVFSSTMLVHAPVQPGDRIDEGSPLEGDWAYPESKITTERLIADERGEIPAVTLRIAGVYDDDGHSPPLAGQIRRISEAELTSHVYPGPLDRGQDFVHLDDVADAFAQSIDRRHTLPAETVLLIGEGRTYGYGEVQDAIGRAVGQDGWWTLRVPQLPAKAGAAIIDRLAGDGASMIKPFFVAQADHHYALDTSKAKELLGWEARHRLLDEIPEMVRHLRADPEGWYRENGFANSA